MERCTTCFDCIDMHDFLFYRPDAVETQSTGNFRRYQAGRVQDKVLPSVVRSVHPLVYDAAVSGISYRSQGLTGSVVNLYGTRWDVSAKFICEQVGHRISGSMLRVLVVAVVFSCVSRHKR